MIYFRWTTLAAALVSSYALCIHTIEAFSASQQLHLHQYDAPTWSRKLFRQSSHMTLLQMAKEDRSIATRESDLDEITTMMGGQTLSKKLGIDQRSLGILVLMTVPLAWGTYGPVVRFLYAIQPPVPGFVFSAGYYGVAAVTMMSLLATQKGGGTANVTQNSDGDEEYDNSQSTAALSTMPFQGGLELGSYLFIGNCLQIVGLKTVESDRAGFLVQLTTILVPILEGILAGNLLAVPARTWLSCALAFCGVSVMNFDSEGMSSIFQALTSFTKGDIEILAAAFCYTLHVVRLGRYARETTPLQLAASKATVEFFLSSSVVLALLAIHDDSSTGFVAESATEISSFFSSFSAAFSSGTLPITALVSALGATLWTGWVTCAYTIYAQSFGQQRVNPTDANLIYSIQPIFTALFAFLLLGETMDGTGVIGGILIGAGILLVATDVKNDSDADNKDGSGGAELISTVEAPNETKERVAVSASKIEI